MDDVDAIVAGFHHVHHAVQMPPGNFHAVEDRVLDALISGNSFGHIFNPPIGDINIIKEFFWLVNSCVLPYNTTHAQSLDYLHNRTSCRRTYLYGCAGRAFGHDDCGGG